MNKNESKYFNTALLMNESLLQLIDKKEYQFITVKDICEKAGVNRSTFYLHYEKIDDLLTECLENKNKEFQSSFDITGKEFVESITNQDKESLILIKDDYLIPYLTFTKNNKILFKLSYTHSTELKSKEKYDSLVKYILFPILDRFMIDDFKKKYYISYYINGISSIVRTWVEDDCKEDINVIANLIKEIVRI